MSVSLESAIRTCKVDTAYDSKIQSDRFLNPDHMMCPVWNGVDITGRPVCMDSFMTKREGCNSALDRLTVENNVSRPQYFEYMTLNSDGMDGSPSGKTLYADKDIAQVNDITGNYGLDFKAQRSTGCHGSSMRHRVARSSEAYRKGYASDNAYDSHAYRQASGF